MSVELDALDRCIIREVQGDLPLVEKPYEEIAGRLGITTEKLLCRLRALKTGGQLKRIAGILYHRNAGYKFNGMAAWSIDDSRKREAGKLMAGYQHISHVYERPPYPDWPYNIFSMIHGQSRTEVEDTAEMIAEKLEISRDNYIILYSTEELKKTSMQYFTENSGDCR